MKCGNCGAELRDDSQFCPKCGDKVEAAKCKHCGALLSADSAFCDKCGMRTWTQTPPAQQTPSAQNSRTYYPYTGAKAKTGIIATVIGAVISFISRLVNQETFYTYETIVRNKKMVGLDPDTKPFWTILPVLALLIATWLILRDEETMVSKKVSAFVICGVFFALSLVFIWFDIPYKLLDF